MSLSVPSAPVPAAHPWPVFAWDDARALDRLRLVGDPAADACAAALADGGATATELRRVLASFRADKQQLPAGTPAPLRDFVLTLKATGSSSDAPALPAWADRERILRGQTAFMTSATMSVLVMLCRSLPEGYAAPSMAQVLNLSGELRARPFHRLMGTLQLLKDVSSPGSFEPGGVGPMVALEMRLLHAGVRTNVAPVAMGDRFASFTAQYGVPINQEDMLGTVLGFSTLVIEGLATMRVAHTEEEAEDYYHVWRVFGHLMGIRRPDMPDDADSMPATLAEARAFYATYHRHYVGASSFQGDFRKESEMANPDGVSLADAHVKMLKSVMPKHWQLILGDRVARVIIRDLTSEGACARVGIKPVAGHRLFTYLLARVPRWWERVTGLWGAKTEVLAAKWFFGALIKTAYSQPITYTVPRTLQDVRDLVDNGERSVRKLP